MPDPFIKQPPIQVIPPGLLGFLQLKNGGQNPRQFPEVLQPVLELMHWYLFANSEVVLGTDAAIAAAGLVNYLTVPDDEFWAVHDVQAAVTLAAGSTAVLSIYYRSGPSGGAANFPFSLSEAPVIWTEATMGNGAIARMERERPLLIVPPGGALGVRAHFLSAASTTGNVAARITRLPA